MLADDGYVMVRDGAWWHVMEYVLLPLLLLLLLLLLQLLLLLTVFSKDVHAQGGE